MPPLAKLCFIFFRVGNFTFGGGAPTTAALQRELVEKHRWLSEEDFSLSYALARVTPGTNLFAFCTASAWQMRGWWGALLALIAASGPACAIVWATTAGFDRVSSNPWVSAGIAGALASSVGALVASFWLLVRPSLVAGNRFKAVVIVAASIALSVGLDMSPVAVLVVAAVVGWFW